MLVINTVHRRVFGIVAVVAASLALATGGIALSVQRKEAIDPPPTPQDWTALARLPDWSGIWVPDLRDQDAQIRTNPVPWKADIAKEVARLTSEERAGRPKGLFATCLPEGMPSWMLISHNALEVLFTPGRVTLLGESDGNRLRRIYTDGRTHPPDPDPSFHGHSIARWDGDTLVVDTVGVLPESYIAISEAVGVPNNGDMHIVERIRLQAPNRLTDELTIEAPHVMTRPWRTTRLFTRQRDRNFEIVEGVCVQGFFSEKKDEKGNDVFVPVPHGEGGNTLPIGK